DPRNGSLVVFQEELSVLLLLTNGPSPATVDPAVDTPSRPSTRRSRLGMKCFQFVTLQAAARNAGPEVEDSALLRHNGSGSHDQGSVTRLIGEVRHVVQQAHDPSPPPSAMRTPQQPSGFQADGIDAQDKPLRSSVASGRASLIPARDMKLSSS